MGLTDHQLSTLADWLRPRLGLPDGTAVIQTGTPTGGGHSNETIFVEAGRHRLVLRMTPAGPSMFPTYDLGTQVACLRHLTNTPVPVPDLIGYEPDPTILERPFYLTARVDGDIPGDDDPPFTKAGFLFEATPQEQRRFHDSAIDRIAAVHCVDPPTGLGPGPAPAGHLAWCNALHGWATDGTFGPDPLDRIHAELAATAPAAATNSATLLWGDARPANMVARNFEVVALLDWELAGTGPGEFDIAWFCEMNRMRTVGMGIAPLPGFPDEDATWARWSAATGREPQHRAWHQRFAAYKVAVLMRLYLRALVLRGKLATDHRLLEDNPGTRRVAELTPGSGRGQDPAVL